RNLGGADHLRNVEVALGRPRRPDANGLVGKADVQGVAVGFGVDRNRLYAQLPAGAEDPKRDFAAIGDQDFSEHFTRKGSLEKVRLKKDHSRERLLLAVRVDAK